MIKNIVFDMGNVLIRFDARRHVSKYTENEMAEEILFREIFLSKEWVQYDRGVIDLAGIIAAVQERVEDKYHDLIRSIVNDWHEDLPAFADMENLISRLKANGYKIYLLSNVSKAYYKFRGNIPALKYFDGEFISADHNIIKPEKEIYLKFYKEFNLIPEECFFIDDLCLNIESAERTGMKGFVYHGNIENLCSYMESLAIRTQ